MQWESRFSVGVPLIDEQHQEVFRHLSALHAALRQGDKAEVERMLEFLGRYVVSHFRAEEEEMVRTGYWYLASHRAAHEHFLGEYALLRAEHARTGATPRLSARLEETVSDWLRNHILGMDQLLGRFLLARQGLAAPVADVASRDAPHGPPKR